MPCHLKTKIPHYYYLWIFRFEAGRPEKCKQKQFVNACSIQVKTFSCLEDEHLQEHKSKNWGHQPSKGWLEIPSS